jgi:predicted ester cyclase
MSTEQNKAIVRRAFEQLYDQRHVEVMDELWAKEFVHHWSGQEQGWAAWRESMRRFFSSGPAPDLHLVIEDMIAEGDKVVLRFTWSHTHTVPSLGVAPTGKRISWTGISINRLSNGKIVEEWANFDDLGRQRQLGKIA